MNILRILKVALFLVVSTSYVPISQAVMLEFSPQNQVVQFGDQATVDIFATDLTGEFVGAYDFFVNYDSSILGIADFIFADSLGGPLSSIETTDFQDGSINAAAVSLLFDLTSLQDGVSDVLLFSVVFDTLALGVSDLLFQENILGIAGGFLGDEVGAPLLTAVTAGSIEVVDSLQVAEPSLLFLLLAGLLAGVFSRQLS